MQTSNKLFYLVIVLYLVLLSFLVVFTNGCATIQHEISGEADYYSHSEPIYVIITGNIPTTLNTPDLL